MYEIVDKCIVMYYNVNELEEKNCIKLLYEFCIVTLIAHVCERVLKYFREQLLKSNVIAHTCERVLKLAIISDMV